MTASRRSGGSGRAVHFRLESAALDPFDFAGTPPHYESDLAEEPEGGDETASQDSSASDS